MTVLTAHHTTTYRYRRAVAFGQHHMMVQPRDWPDQRVVEHAVTIIPEPAKIEARQDIFGNWITTVSFDRPASELSFESRLRVETVPQPDSLGVDGDRSLAPSDGHWLLRPAIGSADPVQAWAYDIVGSAGRASPLDRLTRLNSAVRATLRYVRRLEKGTQPAADTLRLGSGSCRDFATLMIDAARALGFPARFASGYIRVPSGRHAIVGGGSTHAWLQVHLPNAGWIDFDPTNGTVGTGDLIRVAVASRASEALPLCGTWTGNARDCIGMTVTVTVSSDAALNGKRSSLSTRLAAAAAH